MNELKIVPAYFGKTTSLTGDSVPGTIERLPQDAAIHEGNTQVLRYADVAVAGTQTEECVVVPILDAGFSDVGDAIVTKIHGTLPYEIHVASEAAYLARSTSSPNADTLIPSQFFIEDSSRIKLAHDATDNAFEFLYVLPVPPASGFASGWDPAYQEGSSGYPLIEVMIPYQDQDAWSIDVPGGNSPEAIFAASGVDIFVVMENPETGERELQLFGCTQNSAPIDIHPEFSNIVKGAQGGVYRSTVESRPMTITGNTYAHNGWIWKYLYGASQTGSDGVYRQYEVTTDFQQWKTVEVVYSSFTLDGRIIRVWAPNSTIRATGDFDPGSAETMSAFEVQMGQAAYIKQTDDLYSVYRFTIDQTIT